MDITTINELWRPYYGKLVQGLRLLTPEWRTLANLTNFEELSNRQITWPVDLLFGGGVAYTTDGGSTARAVSNAPVEATDTWKHMTRRFEVSYDVMTAENAAKFARNQIVKQMKYQVRDALRSFRKSVAINMYGYNTGVVAKVNSAAGAPTYTLKDRYGVAGLAVDGSFFQPNIDYVAIIDPGGPTIRGIEKVTAVDRSVPDFTLAGSVAGAAANDLVVFANHLSNVAADTDTDQNDWFNGLMDITRATTLHGISSATYPDWSAAVNKAAFGAALSGKTLALYFTEAELESDYAPNFAWTTPGVIAEAGGSQLDQIRYTADENTMRLGFKNLNVMGVQTEARPFCPPGYFFAGNSRALRKLSPDSGEAKKVKTGGPSEFVYYGDNLGYFCDHVFRPQLTAVSRKAMIVMDGVTETAL